MHRIAIIGGGIAGLTAAYELARLAREGIAVEAYKHLLNQRKYDASYRSVFNLVWYGLQPLPLGLADTTKPPTLDDGIFFPPLVEGKPGVQPERVRDGDA